MSFTHDQIAALQAPLDKSNVKTREQAGRELPYIEAWKVIEEANNVFGFDAWSRETVDLQETNRDLVTLTGSRGEYQQWRVGYLAKVRVVVSGVVREGTGFGSGMSKPEALGEAIESAIKEAESDAMKRALMTFGYRFGLALYDKTQANVADVGYAATDFAIATMRTCATADEFKEFWAKNKDGLKRDLPAAEYRRIVAAMQEEAKRFAPAETPFTPEKKAA